MLKLKVTTVGSSSGVVLPKEALARLKVKKGDSLFLIETPDGYQITPYDPDFAEAMSASREFVAGYRNTLRTLAEN